MDYKNSPYLPSNICLLRASITAMSIASTAVRHCASLAGLTPVTLWLESHAPEPGSCSLRHALATSPFGKTERLQWHQ